MSDSRFVFGLSAFKPQSPKEKALSKLSSIILLFIDEHKFNLESLFDLRDLIIDIEESEK